MEPREEAMLLVVDVAMNVARAITPMVSHIGTPVGYAIAEVAQNMFAKALDLAIAAHGYPPHETFKILSKWGVCIPTDYAGFGETLKAVATGTPDPHPCVVIHQHGDYDLVHCRRGTNGGIFCLVDADTGEEVAEDVMPKLLGDFIENLPNESRV